VSQTKYCCSLKVKPFDHPKILGWLRHWIAKTYANSFFTRFLPYFVLLCILRFSTHKLIKMYNLHFLKQTAEWFPSIFLLVAPKSQNWNEISFSNTWKIYQKKFHKLLCPLGEGCTPYCRQIILCWNFSSLWKNWLFRCSTLFTNKLLFNLCILQLFNVTIV